MIASQNAKGPAEVAASPSHVRNFRSQEIIMNSYDDSIAAPGLQHWEGFRFHRLCSNYPTHELPLPKSSQPRLQPKRRSPRFASTPPSPGFIPGDLALNGGSVR